MSHVSILHYLIGIFYLILFSRLLWLSKWHEHFGISQQRLQIIFLLKVFWCLAFILIHVILSGGGDTLDFYQAGEQVYRSLFRDPRDYLRLVFLPNHWYVSESLYHYNQAINRYGDESTFLLIRLNAIFRLFSFGSYTAHAVMFSFCTLPGILYLYLFFNKRLQLGHHKSFLLILLLPVTAFWIHGIHKEALLLSAMGYLFYLSSNRTLKLGQLLYALIALFVILIVRSHYLLILLPALLALWVYSSKQFPVYKTYLMCVCAIVMLSLIYLVMNHVNLIGYIEHHREEYIRLDNTKVSAHLDIIDLFNAPFKVLISPLNFIETRWSLSLFLQYLLTFSSYFIILIQIRKRHFQLNSVGTLLILTALMEFTIIGLIVVQDGGISRYRAPMLCLFIAGFLNLWEGKKSKICSDGA